MAKKDITSLTSEELFELAKQREHEEWEQEKEAMRAHLAELRAEKKKMLARHKRELADLDVQIAAAGGRTRGGTGGKKGAQTGISSAVMEVLAGAKKADTKMIREQLEAQGINTTNLGQTLAYLKRTGRVKSVGRGVYASA
jgi:hypothetical protein